MKDKKKSKFRKWLIEKLGVIDARETPQVIINDCSKNIINLESKAILENYKKEFVTETMVKRYLKDELWEQLTPYISCYSTYDLEKLATVYKARLTIVAEVQNER